LNIERYHLHGRLSSEVREAYFPMSARGHGGGVLAR
jgi:hypothetical protein